MLPLPAVLPYRHHLPAPVGSGHTGSTPRAFLLQFLEKCGCFIQINSFHNWFAVKMKCSHLERGLMLLPFRIKEKRRKEASDNHLGHRITFNI